MTVIVVSPSSTKVAASPDWMTVLPTFMTAVGAFGSSVTVTMVSVDAGHHGRGVVKGSARERGRESYAAKSSEPTVWHRLPPRRTGSL